MVKLCYWPIKNSTDLIFLQSLKTVNSLEAMKFAALQHTNLYRNIAGWLQRLQGWSAIKTAFMHIYTDRYNDSIEVYIRHDNVITKQTIHSSTEWINQNIYLSTKGCLRVIKFFPFHLVSNISVKYSERALRTQRWAGNVCPWTRNLTSLCRPCSSNLRQKTK